jgi:hypothetical protein
LTYSYKYDIVFMPKIAHARFWKKERRVIFMRDAGFLVPKLSVPDRCGNLYGTKTKKER